MTEQELLTRTQTLLDRAQGNSWVIQIGYSHLLQVVKVTREALLGLSRIKGLEAEVERLEGELAQMEMQRDAADI